MQKLEEDSFLQMVIFHLAKEEFAFDIAHVKEIVRLTPITRVPKSPDFIEGVINLRGNVIPVSDLRKRFHMSTQNNRNTRIIIVEIKGIILGMVVDQVLETRQISRAIIEPVSSVVQGIEAEYIIGVAKLEDRLISLLHMDKILNLQELLKEKTSR